MKKIMVCVPCREYVDSDFANCLIKMVQNNRSVQMSVELLPGTIISMSRDRLCEKAIKEKSDYVIFIDSDMTFSESLVSDLLECDKDIVTGLCFMRKEPFEPCIYKELKLGLVPEDAIAEKYLNYPDELFEVDACGCAAMLIKREVLEDVLSRTGALFEQISGYGEDISFCIRAKKCGYHIFCDPKPEIGHIGKAVISRMTYETLRRRQNAIKN